MTNFRESYPIDFDLYDKDTQNVLYIEDTSDQLLTLEIENASAETIQLEDLTANPVSSSNYHFALRFRPGTLSAVTLGGAPNGMQLATATAQSWEMALVTKENDASGMDVVYLKNLSAGLSMAPGDSQSIVFEHVGADAGQGARGTRVELLYQNMAFSSAPTLAVSSYREIHLGVINHRGKQNLPLHVSFVGDNGVLNDGATANALTLRFSNTLVYDAANPDISQLTFLYNADTSLRSRIVLSFDVGVSTDGWALGDSNDINGITFNQPNWAITKDTSGQSPEWILYPDTQDQVLYGENDPSGNEYFDLNITNIITAFPTGHTQLHIRYENIPGYWDGQMRLAIEKRSLVYNGGNVGIGTIAPETKLDVSALLEKLGSNNNNMRGPGVNFSTTNDLAHQWTLGTIYGVIGNPGKTGGYPGGLAFYTKPNSGGQGGAAEERMRIDYKGNVGIGTTDPSVKLEVEGTIKTSGVIQTDGTGDNYLQGNVGIGTDNPGAKLDVNGDIRVKGVKPIIYNTFQIYQDNPDIPTSYAYSDYVLAVVGFSSGADGNIDGVRIYPHRVPQESYWRIKADLVGKDDDSWSVVVLAIRRELVDLQDNF